MLMSKKNYHIICANVAFGNIHLIFLFAALVVVSQSSNENLIKSIRKVPSSGSPPYRRQGAIFEMPFGSTDKEILLACGINDLNAYKTPIYKYSFRDSIHSWGRIEVNGVGDTPECGWFAHFSTKSKLYIWGGEGPDGFYNDMWIFDYKRKTWTQEVQLDAPSARNMLFYTMNPGNNPDENGVFFIFGGRSASGALNDLWKYELSTGSWTELIPDELSPENNKPTPRYGGAAHYFDESIYITGGYPVNEDEVDNLKIYRFDLNTNIWSVITIPDITSDRNEVGFYSVNGELFIYSGVNYPGGERSNLKELLRIKFEDDTAKCRKYDLSSLDGVEYARRSPAFIAVNDKINNDDVIVCYVFGGLGDELVQGDLISIVVPKEFSSSDPWILSQETTVIEELPPLRAWHKSVSLLGKMWVYGGMGEGDMWYQSQVPMDDLYSFDYKTQVWKKHEGTGEHPALYDYSIVEQSSRLFLFGGFRSETIMEDPTPRNDIWEYSTKLNEWSKIEPTTSLRPSPRSGAAAAVIGKWIYYVGGRLEDDTVTNEVWRFSLVTYEWRQMKVYYSPNIEIGGSAFEDLTFDPNAQGTVPAGDDSPAQLQKREGMSMVRKDVWKDGVEYQVLVIAGGVKLNKDPTLVIDVLLIPPSFDAEEGKTPEDSDPEAFKVYVGDPVMLDPEVIVEHPFKYGGMVAIGDQCFISFGGSDEGHSSDIFHKVDVKDLKNVKCSYYKGGNGEPVLPFLSGGTVQYYQRQLYAFGGNLMANACPTLNQYHNEMIVIDLSEQDFSCSPGTKHIESNNACEPCPIGTFSWRYNLNYDCTQCYAGSANAFEGGSSGYHCIACPFGTYNSETGKGQCTICEETQYCPIASAANNGTAPKKTRETDVQPELYQVRDNDSMLILICCYAAFFFVGVVVALIIVCCPCRVYLYKVDLYSGEHDDDFDPETQAAPKTLRKTRVGGFVSIVFIFFAIGAAASVLGDYIINNRFETKSVIAAAMEPDLNVTGMPMNRFETLITMKDYCGECVEGVSDVSVETDWGTCSDELSIDINNVFEYRDGKAYNFTPQCRQSPSGNMMMDKVTDCLIRLKGDQSVIYFPTDGSSPYLNITSHSESAHAYAFLADVTLDTGIKHEKKASNDVSLSSKQMIAVSSTGKPFKGTVPTIFEVTAIPSIFIDPDNNKTTGYQVISSSTTLGSVASEDQLNIIYGMMVRLVFKQETSIVRTTFTVRQSVTSFLANLMSTAMGYMGIFGIFVGVLDFITTRDFPCSTKMRMMMYGTNDLFVKKKKEKGGVASSSTDEEGRKVNPYGIHKPREIELMDAKGEKNTE
ncbi:uncharacterized protein MONOS_14245 [Monocercomonoides exilis]|uniref:uncharacterized protein n=1 Tax=Monocercomonoides exilis TaxID=2049356 RepID=UPI00355A2D60|nr:hypothetical protein MONOS_14245 [Monocercomonoides exilis]|eukprot:MONOS_14245.1-p1 / transcript=MONOS_14245.1 / gene=MONOS_14245 / organism=Monocercomonoides_exilis_PA203 / gene_product=unspecified product / transcript_product=unspecified product / location=Mono_scaffold00962:2499-6599(+) / protein_length=1317 / sequence_SO=supercontig / SO=protein_coding / is_pseudo=false